MKWWRWLVGKLAGVPWESMSVKDQVMTEVWLGILPLFAVAVGVLAWLLAAGL